MYFRLRLVSFLFFLFVIVPFGNAENEQVLDDQPYRLIFSDFESNSAGKYGYLRDSIQTMLASRLTAHEKIIVVDTPLSAQKIDKLKGSKDTRDQITNKLNADYLISGALYSLKSGLNIQLTLHPLNNKDEVLRFSIVSDTTTSLLTDIEKLSAEIARDAFGQSKAAQVFGAKNTNPQGNSGFVTEHPEAAFKKKLYSGGFTTIKGSGVKTSVYGAKKSLEVPLELVSMAVGDINRDGREEILVLSENEIQLFDLTEEGIELLAQKKLPADKRNHAINIADINGDGSTEVYISATKNLDVSSMILTWQKESGFVLVADDIPWYLRPVKMPDGQWSLLGQKRGNEKIVFVQPGIFELQLSDDFVVKELKKIALPQEINLFDFTYADLDGDGYSELAVIDKFEKMRVYSSSNELLWVSKRSFGGSSIYLGPSQGDAVNDSEPWGLTVNEESDREPIFVPNRLIVKDFDQDGSAELIVNENEATYFNFFAKIRIYASSMVVGMRWNGEAMQEVWRTGKYDGVISAYSFISTLSEKGSDDALSIGKDRNTGRLFIGHIPAKGTLRDLLPGQLDSELKVYDMEFTATEEKKQD